MRKNRVQMPLREQVRRLEELATDLLLDIRAEMADAERLREVVARLTAARGGT
jgi:hypothetical protein